MKFLGPITKTATPGVVVSVMRYVSSHVVMAVAWYSAFALTSTYYFLLFNEIRLLAIITH